MTITKATVERFLEKTGASDNEITNKMAEFDSVTSEEGKVEFMRRLYARFPDHADHKSLETEPPVTRKRGKTPPAPASDVVPPSEDAPVQETPQDAPGEAGDGGGEQPQG